MTLGGVAFGVLGPILIHVISQTGGDSELEGEAEKVNFSRDSSSRVCLNGETDWLIAYQVAFGPTININKEETRYFFVGSIVRQDLKT